MFDCLETWVNTKKGQKFLKHQGFTKGGSKKVPRFESNFNTLKAINIAKISLSKYKVFYCELDDKASNLDCLGKPSSVRKLSPKVTSFLGSKGITPLVATELVVLDELRPKSCG